MEQNQCDDGGLAIPAEFGWTTPGCEGETVRVAFIDNRTMPGITTTFVRDQLKTPIGTALLVTDANGVLCALDWEDFEARMTELLRRQHGAVALKDGRAPQAIRAALSAYFDGDLNSLDTIKWRVAGTPFQRKVWTALPKIRAGTTMSYGALASRLKMPKAVRAVGHANGANPLSVVVPCHRLIGADGSLVKYGGGLSRKRWLLAHEGVEL
jgi:methylated-DNA-[protein]-cysteine S-methyltransferase